MESECLPDKPVDVPPVPIKTYQWEDLRRARDVGAYPWTHLLKPELEGEITAEDVLRESTPKRSMSRDVSRDRSRTRSPDADFQKILNLDSSPGSSRKIGEDGDEQGIHIPNFSKEVSLDSEDDPINDAVEKYLENDAKNKTGQLLMAPRASPIEVPKNISPKGILKRRTPEPTITKISESREKTKCCHPLVNKLKHMADKTLHKHDKSDTSPNVKRKKKTEEQPIVQLKSSPGAIRRKQFSAIKLGDSDEMSNTLSIDNQAPPRKMREHIYEDIDQTTSAEVEPEKILHFSPEVLDTLSRPPTDSDGADSYKENESYCEKKSNASQDPSLYVEEDEELRPEEHVMESLHRQSEIQKEALMLEVDEEPDIEDIIQNQLEETYGPRSSPNITITEITDEETESNNPSPLPKEPTREITSEQPPDAKTIDTTEVLNDWSKPNSDHEYEIIGKPPPNIVFTTPSVDQDTSPKHDDELSSTTSLERKYLQNASEDEEQHDDKTHFDDLNRHEVLSAEAMQKDIEDRYFANTPSSVSRTECEISTSQVDSSALENLPLKRESRLKNMDTTDSKFQQKIREQTGKLRTQAGKLKTKLQNIKAKQFSMPEKSKFQFPQLPERPKFSLPDRRKFSLPERPKFKKINISEKLSLSDRKKFTFPDRPKFTMPDLPKFKIPEKAKINFPSLSRKKESRVEPESTDSSEDIKNIATVEFESRTYPRACDRNKKPVDLASSSPTLNRADTPPPIFTYAKIPKDHNVSGSYQFNSTEEPREYGNLPRYLSLAQEDIGNVESFSAEYDFDKLEREYDEENRTFHEAVKAKTLNEDNASSLPDVSSAKPVCTHVINEINNDEFFVRPKGISRENIQVRQYLSDEIREAFKMPSNSLAQMGIDTEMDSIQVNVNEEDADPELYLDDESESYVNEDPLEKDDGYYTFPPVRPSRAKRMKKEFESNNYVDRNMNASIQFSDVDLDRYHELENMEYITTPPETIKPISEKVQSNKPHVLSQTLPTPPKRKKKSLKSDVSLTSLNELNKSIAYAKPWREQPEENDDIIVYRTEHEYVVPETSAAPNDQSPLPPRRSRNRSRSSHGTSFGDDDRTSHGAESLTLDQNISTAEPGVENYREDRQESPGYATVDKYPLTKIRRSKSKTPPVRPRKSHSSERKYYTVGRVPEDSSFPNRPQRKKSSTSLMTLDSYKRGISSGDITQYVEIDEHEIGEAHKDLKSGDIISKMKDRPLPPPPRPPRGPKRRNNSQDDEYICRTQNEVDDSRQVNGCDDADTTIPLSVYSYGQNGDVNSGDEIVEIEVSTQTDPLPDDIDYELGLDEHIDVSITSSLRDIVEDDILCKSQTKLTDSPRFSRPQSKSDKYLLAADPKIQELSKISLGRTSPTVILVERRVSSPTRINERDEIVTEASLTVQPINIDESAVPEVPPLPEPSVMRPPRRPSKSAASAGDDKALEKLGGDSGQVLPDVQIDNLVTQRLQVRDLDVGRLNVSELQAGKILVSEIEGMTLQVTELDSKSGHISVSGIELSPSVIDEIVKKFAELATTNIIPTQSAVIAEPQRPVSREEQTQTDEQTVGHLSTESINQTERKVIEPQQSTTENPLPYPMTQTGSAELADPPVRPPPPDLSPLLYSYLQDLSIPPASFYQLRAPRERPFTEFFESQHSVPPPPTRRAKRKPVHHSESSSDEDKRRPSPRRMPPPSRIQEPTITEAGAQFIRVCQSSISRTIRSIFNSLMSYVSGSEEKKDVQMALVIFLVLIAGLIMFGLSDGRTVHHHHWEFFNPPDGNNK